jgi:SulP family sulfate permease
MRWTGRFEGYNAAALRKDLVAGLIVGIIAIPLGMAFAIASGVKPEYGIYTIVVAGILISLFGGSRVQIGGPTGAFIPILLAIVMQYGYENLLIAGMMAGVLLVLMGVFKLGALVRFIPRPVTTGFTAGIAVIIFSGQIASFLGLKGVEKHETFLPNMKEIVLRLPTINLYSVTTALICLIVILLAPKLMPKVPGSLAGLVVSTVVAVLFFGGKVDTIGSVYGAIPSSLPELRFPDITWEKIGTLWSPALVIAMLGAIESLLSAVVADSMSGDRHNSNRELIGQGIANIVTPLFGGIPATGAIARTAANVKNGGVSPIAGVTHGVVVLLVLVLFAPYASYIPLASMAPILMVVAWNMSDRKEFAHILSAKSSDSLVLVITFLLTVLTDLPTAVEIGLLLAVVLFVVRMSGLLKVTKVLPDPAERAGKVREHVVAKGCDCPQIAIFTIDGPLFFGTADRFERAMTDMIRNRPKIVLLRMSKVPHMDTSGEARLAELVKQCRKQGCAILVAGVQPQPLDILKQSGLYAEIGESQFFPRTGQAIDFALQRLDTGRCKGCSQFAFRECAALAGAENGSAAAVPSPSRLEGGQKAVPLVSETVR